MWYECEGRAWTGGSRHMLGARCKHSGGPSNEATTTTNRDSTENALGAWSLPRSLMMRT